MTDVTKSSDSAFNRCLVPLSSGILVAAAHAEQAHARYVYGSRGSMQQSAFEVEDAAIPLPLPLVRRIVERLEAWGASRLAFLRLSPDCDSNQLFPVFIAGEMPGGILAGVACVQVLQD